MEAHGPNNRPAEYLDYRVSTYEPHNRAAVLDLLKISLGGWRNHPKPDEWFDWKHSANPFGASSAVVAVVGESIVGFRAFMRWRFRKRSTPVHAVRGADAAVHPGHRRRGIWAEMTRVQLNHLKGESLLYFTYGHPHTRAGYRQIGWSPVFELEKQVFPVRPLRLVARKLGGRFGVRTHNNVQPMHMDTATEVLDDEGAVRDLIASSLRTNALMTDRSLDYFRWRYGAAPGRDYKALTVSSSTGLRGLAFLQLRDSAGLLECELADFVIRDHDRKALKSMLWAAARLRPDYISVLLPTRSLAASIGASLGSLTRLGYGNVLLIHQTGDAVSSPADPTNWNVSLGDFDPGF